MAGINAVCIIQGKLMGYKKLKAKEELPPQEQSTQLRSNLDIMSKQIRRINPLGMRVVVRFQGERDVSEGGLYLPEGAKQNMQESLVAEVIEVASATDDHTHEETNVSGIPLGAKVLIKKNAGVKVPWDESLRIVETQEVLALVSEFTIT